MLKRWNDACFNEWIELKMGNIVDAIENRIRNTNLTAIDNVTPKIELAIRSVHASSGRDATSVTANSELGERMGIAASFESVSEKKNALHVLHTNDETRNNFPDKAEELSVPGARFGRQPHTHHTKIGNTT